MEMPKEVALTCPTPSRLLWETQWGWECTLWLISNHVMSHLPASVSLLAKNK